MATSEDMTGLLEEYMSNRRGIYRVELCWDGRIGFITTNVDSLLAKMHEMSLAYVVGDMAMYSPFWEQPYLAIYLQPSIDGQTNIDSEFMEKLSELTIIPIIGKEGTVK